MLLDHLGVNEHELMNGFYVISTLFAGVTQTIFSAIVSIWVLSDIRIQFQLDNKCCFIFDRRIFYHRYFHSAIVLGLLIFNMPKLISEYQLHISW